MKDKTFSDCILEGGKEEVVTVKSARSFIRKIKTRIMKKLQDTNSAVDAINEIDFEAGDKFL
ncbi:MAG: hypothetical protein IH845_05345 [Nanoarchaeota archaeon]|nr:hypothetical protein [Nanoarchaeota archaeon]